MPTSTQKWRNKHEHLKVWVRKRELTAVKFRLSHWVHYSLKVSIFSFWWDQSPREAIPSPAQEASICSPCWCSPHSEPPWVHPSTQQAFSLFCTESSNCPSLSGQERPTGLMSPIPGPTFHPFYWSVSYPVLLSQYHLRLAKLAKSTPTCPALSDAHATVPLSTVQFLKWCCCHVLFSSCASMLCPWGCLVCKPFCHANSKRVEIDMLSLHTDLRCLSHSGDIRRG